MDLQNDRYPSERRILVITFLALTLLQVLLAGVSVGLFGMLTVSMFLGNYMLIRMQRARLMRGAVRVSEHQLQDVHRLVQSCTAQVKVPPSTQVFVVYSPIMNAAAFGFFEPYSVFIHSAILDAMDEDEVKFIIGHELGHIHFGHTWLLTLLGTLGQVPTLLGLPAVFVALRMPFLWWNRAAEFSADRAGLWTCGKLDKALSAQLKLAVGPTLASQINLDELAQQARDAQGDWTGEMAQAWSTHPFMLSRVRQLIEFSASPAFQGNAPDACRGTIDQAVVGAWQSSPGKCKGRRQDSPPSIGRQAYNMGHDLVVSSGTRAFARQVGPTAGAAARFGARVTLLLTLSVVILLSVVCLGGAALALLLTRGG
ncbi:MAG: M48 family metallopeptidase [Anaerolineae bacterium]